MQNHNDKILASIAHLSVFTKYFFPFGNFICPLFIWVTNRHKNFVEAHSKNAINFQLSIFLYLIVLGCIGLTGLLMFGVNTESFGELYFSENGWMISQPDKLLISPILIFSLVVVILALGILLLELLCVINAAVKAGEGKMYKYPFSIPFIKTDSSAEEIKTDHTQTA